MKSEAALEKKDLSIIIVNYNTTDLLLQCLHSIFNKLQDINYEVLVVDNASTDKDVSLIQKQFPLIRLISNEVNRGFAKANNQGIKIARGEYVLFLNPDTEIQDDSLGKMMEFMRAHRDAGALGPRLIYPEGTLQLSCRNFYTLRSIIMRRTPLGKIFSSSKSLREHLMSDWDHRTVREVDWVVAACLMTRSEILQKIGNFDEAYTLYFEDVDLCYRIKKAGYKIRYFPEVTVLHHHRRESARRFSWKTIWHIESGIHFFNKFGWRF